MLMQDGTDDLHLHHPLAAHHQKELPADLTNRRTGRPFIAPSKPYKQYEEKAIKLLTNKPKAPVQATCRVVTLFYMPTRRRVDLTNLMEAAHDVLVAA